MISRWVVGVILLFAVLLFMLPKSDEETLSRIASASMLKCTQNFRERVARQVLSKGVVDVKFNNKCSDLIGSLVLDEQGRMIITGKSYSLRMTLSAVVEGEKIRWRCRGEPAAAVTKLCKP
ncbi:hypothetical protein [Thiohalophilus thiocyanatoxydans]|uniref:Uncharacterized protein n=1 Tax=Thiohalophilus thiocyanatoxydans TaxID=381308 RepID=A0A4R8ISY2_9GAMM|nr:hypothetical protein [Thiohalophilus thiocyanatoxydans]TDY04152.1 hypothetical protein EDC23_0524 [Thiohalophilus thiocyanatoxydans]